eukprot:TRINITY_DN31648_c0_g1_i1.p1 TRINITY_DN31648_c0_g1~~TRINITY_DN31648_c0_g1_i1.p1  ORF type:complete len:485 (-),score=44.45 TRINITY_DN31648_c0_g1_i1:189-1643(-)
MRALFDKYYAPFLYGSRVERCYMAAVLVVMDVVGGLLCLAYLLAPAFSWIILFRGKWSEAPGKTSEQYHLRTIYYFCLGALLFQIVLTIIPLTGQPFLFLACPQRAGKSGQSTCFQRFRGAFQGLSINSWMWHMTLAIGVKHLEHIHFIVLSLTSLPCGMHESLSWYDVVFGAAAMLWLLKLKYSFTACIDCTEDRNHCRRHSRRFQLPCSRGSRKVLENMEFSSGLKLDIYRRCEGKPRYIMLWVHGGGWVLGERGGGLNGFVSALVENHDWLVCCADYRGARREHGVKLQDQLEDISKAYAWLKEHAGDYGAADVPLCLGGVSAGAFLATLACKHVDPVALVLSSGVYSIDDASLAARPGIRHILAEHVIASEDARAWHAADPVAALSRCPRLPVALFHGTADCIAPISDARALRESLTSSRGSKDGVACHFLYREVPTGCHGWDYFRSECANAAAADADAFLTDEFPKSIEGPPSTESAGD